jgi:hypothetical protein
MSILKCILTTKEILSRKEICVINFRGFLLTRKANVEVHKENALKALELTHPYKSES